MRAREIGVEYFSSGYTVELADPWIMVLTVDDLQWLPRSTHWRLTDLRSDAFRTIAVKRWLTLSDRRTAR